MAEKSDSERIRQLGVERLLSEYSDEFISFIGRTYSLLDDSRVNAVEPHFSNCEGHIDVKLSTEMNDSDIVKMLIERGFSGERLKELKRFKEQSKGPEYTGLWIDGEDNPYLGRLYFYQPEVSKTK